MRDDNLQMAHILNNSTFMEEFDEFEEVKTNVNMRFRELTNINNINKPQFTQLKTKLSKNKVKMGIKIKIQKVEKTKKKQENTKESNDSDDEAETNK